MSEPGRFSFSFSDPSTGRHCYGVDGGRALTLDAAGVGVGVGVGSHADAALANADPESGRWEVALDGVVAAVLEALGPPAAFKTSKRREWLCRVSPIDPAQAAGSEATPGGFGRVAFGSQELDGLSLRRGVWGCFGEDLGFVLSSAQRRRAQGHGEEQVEAFVARGMPLAASRVEDPRLSSTYGADRGLLRTGLELSESTDDDDARPLRIAGETVAAGELAVPSASGGRSVAVSVAFLVMRHARRTGIGCYEIARAVD